MSGRKRRGRRRPWEQREGAGQPGQSRSGPGGPPNGQQPQHNTTVGYNGPSSGQPRWQSGPGPQRPTGNPQFARGRGSDGNQGGQGRRWGNGAQGNGPSGRRWEQGQGSAPGQYAQTRRWQQDARPQRRPQPQEQHRRPEAPTTSSGGAIDPFELFCAYHLGITVDDGYRIQNIHEVARRFGTNAGALKQTLAAYRMDAEDLVHSGFDLASAQIDIMVAPAGISRRELARPLYDEFMDAPRKARDWAREMAEADRQIERTIGQDGRWSPPPRDPSGKQS